MGCPGCEWDPRKDKDFENQRKHGIAFAEACCIFEDPGLKVLPGDRDYGEERWLAIGKFEWRVLVVVYTGRNVRQRIISARRAKRGEEELCFDHLT